MNALEITKTNIRVWGWEIGRSIQGKGTEIITRPSWVTSSWYLNAEDKEEYKKERVSLVKAIEAKGIDRVYAKEIRIYVEGFGTKSFNYDNNHVGSLDRFSIEKLIANDFKNVEFISVYTKPEVKAYWPITKYHSYKESQLDLYKELVWAIDKVEIQQESFDSSWDEPEDLISFSESRNGSSWDYNGDYTLFHGPALCLDDSEVPRIDGKMSNYNDSVVDDFWNFTMADEDPFNYLDPSGRVSVYARKGKDWYVTSGIEQRDEYITYIDEDGELVEEEELWVYANMAEDREVDEVVQSVEEMKKSLEIDGLIMNELEIGSWESNANWEYNDGLFNLPILRKQEYADSPMDMFDIRNEIREYVDYGDGDREAAIVMTAYEKFLTKNMDEREYLFGTYKHLPMLREIVEREGKELVYSRIGDFTYAKAWAVKYRNEEYHFSLADLFETTPKKFYNSISTSLTMRLTEMHEKDVIVSKAERVFVSFNDSIDSGNCTSGTQAFCDRFHIDTKKIGGIRGDALLELDYSAFTRRAVMAAINTKVA